MKKQNDFINTELAKGFTVRDYQKAAELQDRIKIAEAIRKRFMDRYYWPVVAKPKHGFTMMAISCLMIEAIESFRQGWKSSDNRSHVAFKSFFNKSKHFEDLKGHHREFYKNVRCGILHQAETIGGWRIRRDSGPLFDADNLTLNAERFLNAIKNDLDGFCEKLIRASWDSSEWEKVRIKMDSIIENCIKRK
jgi:hypothetical protein